VGILWSSSVLDAGWNRERELPAAQIKYSNFAQVSYFEVICREEDVQRAIMACVPSRAIATRTNVDTHGNF
jgi:hypothetical protein